MHLDQSIPSFLRLAGLLVLVGLPLPAIGQATDTDPNNTTNDPANDGSQNETPILGQESKNMVSRLGTVGATEPTRYFFAGDLVLDRDLMVDGPVEIIVEGSLNVKSQTIQVEETGALKLYVGGNITMTAQGMINNPGRPRNLLLYGRPAEPTTVNYWSIQGGAQFNGAIYAPNASLRLYGSATICGAVICHDMSIGELAFGFHYDKDLMNEGFQTVGTEMGASQTVKLVEFNVSSVAEQTVELDSQQNALTVADLFASFEQL